MSPVETCEELIEFLSTKEDTLTARKYIRRWQIEYLRNNPMPKADQVFIFGVFSIALILFIGVLAQ